MLPRGKVGLPGVSLLFFVMRCRVLRLDELLPHYSERKNGLPIPYYIEMSMHPLRKWLRCQAKERKFAMRLRFCIAGWVELVGVKMRRKRELKELDLQIALLLITCFG